MNANTCLIDRYLSRILLPRCGRQFVINYLRISSPQNKHFQGTHSYLSPLAIQDLELPYAFGIPIESIPHTFGIPVQKKKTLALRFPKSPLWYGISDPSTSSSLVSNV